MATGKRTVNGGPACTAPTVPQSYRRAARLAEAAQLRPFKALRSLGGTARAVTIKMESLEADSVCDVTILSAHELDNMIPPTLLEECILPSDDASFRKRWLDMALSGALSGSESIRYLGIRTGIDGYSYYHTEPGYAFEYIKAAADKLCANAIAACACSPREACSCIYLGGLGGVAVQRAANRLATQTSQKDRGLGSGRYGRNPSSGASADRSGQCHLQRRRRSPGTTRDRDAQGGSCMHQASCAARVRFRKCAFPALQIARADYVGAVLGRSPSGTSQVNSRPPSDAPAAWAAMNPATSAGRMPA